MALVGGWITDKLAIIWVGGIVAVLRVVSGGGGEGEVGGAGGRTCVAAYTGSLGRAGREEETGAEPLVPSVVIAVCCERADLLANFFGCNTISYIN